MISYSLIFLEHIQVYLQFWKVIDAESPIVLFFFGGGGDNRYTAGWNRRALINAVSVTMFLGEPEGR